jgi:hypothetical protein
LGLILAVVRCGRISWVSAENGVGIVGKIVKTAVKRIVDFFERKLPL